MKKKYAILVFSISLLSVLIIMHIWAQRPYKEIVEVVKSLQTEKQVVEAFGKPYKTVHRGSKDYYIKGYSFKHREIGNRVLIYFPDNPTDMVADIIMYVYIDNEGRVEDYFVGGS